MLSILRAAQNQIDFGLLNICVFIFVVHVSIMLFVVFVASVNRA